VDATYANSYRALYERHWWWRAREPFLLDQLRRGLATGSAGRILDVGCGDGLFFDKLSEFGQVEGVEPNGALVSPGRHGGRIHIGPFDESFSPPHRYSAVLMLDVLEHLEYPDKAVRHALRLLETDGRLVVTVPAFKLLWTNHDDINQHFTRYTKKSFLDLAQRSGLQVDRCRYFFFWLFPVKLVARVCEAVLRSEPAPAKVPPRFINTALTQLSRLEEAVGGQLPIPFGSSLLAIGHKSSRTDREGGGLWR